MPFGVLTKSPSGEVGPLTAERSPTALARGLEDGYSYGRSHLADRARLGRIVRAHSPADVVANLDPRFQMPDGVLDLVAYWSGFAHGVQRVLRDTAGDPIPDA